MDSIKIWKFPFLHPILFNWSDYIICCFSISRFFLSLSFLPRFQGKQKVIEDGDLLRRALEKIESLESEMQRLRVSPSAASTPTPSPSTVPTPRDGKPKGTDKVDQHDDDDPIRTPDGVPVF